MIRCDIDIKTGVKYLPKKEAEKLNNIIVTNDAKYAIECYLLFIDSYSIRIKIVDPGIDKPEIIFECYEKIDKNDFKTEINKVLN
jgi:hypothetical protein